MPKRKPNVFEFRSKPKPIRADDPPPQPKTHPIEDKRSHHCPHCLGSAFRSALVFAELPADQSESGKAEMLTVNNRFQCLNIYCGAISSPNEWLLLAPEQRVELHLLQIDPDRDTFQARFGAFRSRVMGIDVTANAMEDSE